MSATGNQPKMEPSPKAEAASTLKWSRGMNISEKDILIAVIGATGSGKSTFIRDLTGHQDVVIGDGFKFESTTSQIEAWAFLYKGQKAYIIDTIGYDGILRDSTEVLWEIAVWLDKVHRKARLAGIIIVHPVTDTPLWGSSMRTFTKLGKLCGWDIKSPTIIVATHWTGVSEDMGNVLLKYLKKYGTYFGMIGTGMMFYRHDGGRSSALHIVSNLIERSSLGVKRRHFDKNLKSALVEARAGHAHQEALLAREALSEKLRKLQGEENNATRDGNVELQEISSERQSHPAIRFEEHQEELHKLEKRLQMIRPESRGSLARAEIGKARARKEQEDHQLAELQRAQEAIFREKESHAESRRVLEAEAPPLNLDLGRQVAHKPSSKHQEQVLEVYKGINKPRELAADRPVKFESMADSAANLEVQRTPATFHEVKEFRLPTKTEKDSSSFDRHVVRLYSSAKDIGAVGESGPGHGPSIRDQALPGNPNSIAASLVDPEKQQEEITPGVRIREALEENSTGPTNNHNPTKHKLQDEIRSIVLEKDEICSQPPGGRSVEEDTVEEHFGVLLAQNGKLRPVFIEALARMEDDRFVHNLRRLLRRFYLDLSADVKLVLQEMRVDLLRHRRSRTRIARQVLDDLKTNPGDDAVRAPGDKLFRLENWISGNSDLAPVDEVNEAKTPLDSSDGDSDPDSDDKIGEGEVGISSKRLNTLGVRKSILTGDPFEALLVDLRMFLLPTTLMPLTRVISSVSSEHVWFSPEDDRSLLNWIKSVAEDHTEGSWDWWPLRSRMKALQKDQIRIHWKCHCNKHLWTEVSKFQAETFQLLLKQRGSITQQNHLCRGRLKRFPAWSFLAGVTHAVGSSQNLQPSNGSTASSLTTSNREPRLSTLIRPTRASGASISRLGQVSSNQQGPHEAIPIISPDHFFVLFGIEGTRKSLELAQIDVKEYKNDSTFFNKLLLEYQPRRGFLRYWFSVWRLSHCDFVKLEKIRSNRIILRGKDLPTDPSYEYTPRPPDAEIPPISPHEFNLAFSSCSPRCILSLFHDCIEPPTGTFAMKRTPKRKSALELMVNAPEFAWGLSAQHSISFAGVVLYHMLILTGAFTFWGWWQIHHPNDIQNAAAPLTVVAILISLFWSSAGIIKSSS